MAITPADIEQLTFSPSKHGYDTEEVDNFLEQLAGEVDAMLQKIADLKGRLNSSEQQLAAAQAQVATLEASQGESTMASVEPAYTPAVVDNSATEHQISQALIVAQQSADRIVSEARDAADKIRNDADQKAREVIRQALAEKQNELDEIDRLKQSREDFRSEYKGMLQRFMDDADVAFPNQLLSNPNPESAKAPVPSYEAPSSTGAQDYSQSGDSAKSQGDFGVDDLD